MKTKTTFNLIAVTFMLVGLMSGCASIGPSVEGAVSDCRTLVGNTWVNPLDANVRDSTVVFNQIELGAEQLLDPSPSCVLEKLGAPAAIFDEIKSSPTGEEFSREWANGRVDWRHVLIDGETDQFDIYISSN
jgi:hypothetical protein